MRNISDLANNGNFENFENFISKRKKRGKPSLIKYSGKYTYDLWELTPWGKEIWKKINIFSKNIRFTTITNHQTTIMNGISETLNFKSVLERYSLLHLSVLKILFDSQEPANLNYIKNNLTPTNEELNKILLEMEEEKLVAFSKPASTGILRKILRVIGLPFQGLKIFELTDEGAELVRDIDLRARKIRRIDEGSY